VNGNGANQARNDNPEVALVSRIAIGTQNNFVAISGYWNDRTQGTLSTRMDERDLAADLDFLVNTPSFAMGHGTGRVKVFGMVTYKNVYFATVPQNARVESWGGVGSISLPVAVGVIVIEPAFRYTYFQPDSTLRTPEGASNTPVPFVLQDATIGVNISPQVIPLRFQINYTDRMAASVWEQPNTLLEFVLQANF
jgi:hypothetical protein